MPEPVDILAQERTDPSVKVNGKRLRASQLERMVDALITAPAKRQPPLAQLRDALRPAIIRNQQPLTSAGTSSDVKVSGGGHADPVALEAVATTDPGWKPPYDEVGNLVTGAMADVVEAVARFGAAEHKLARLAELGNQGRGNQVDQCVVCSEDALPRPRAGRCERCYRHRRDHDHDYRPEVSKNDVRRACALCERERLERGEPEGMCWRCGEEEAQGDRELCPTCSALVKD